MMNPLLDALMPHLRRFAPHDVGNAAEHVGLYAWYPVLDAGQADWKAEMDGDGNDLGIQRLRSLLQRHSTRFNTQPLHVRAVGRLTASWEGTIQGQTAAILEQTLVMQPASADDDALRTTESRGRNALAQAVNAPAQRERLVALLRGSVPLLSAPVYVGVSDCLRRRLQEHATDLSKLYSAATQEPTLLGRYLEKDLNFACRAVGAGFTPDTLEVWTLDLQTLFPEISDLDQLRVLAEAAEWLLNRWSRPLFGKR